MPIINSYPTITPKGEDLLLLSDISEDGNPTKTASVNSILALAPGGGGGGSISTIQSQDTTYLSVTNPSGPVTTLAVNAVNIASFVVSSKNLPQVSTGSGTEGSIPVFTTPVSGISQLKDSVISQDSGNGVLINSGADIKIYQGVNSSVTLGNSSNAGGAVEANIPFQFKDTLLDTSGSSGANGSFLVSLGSSGIAWTASSAMQNWVINGDTGSDTIVSAETVAFTGGAKITTELTTVPTILKISHTGASPTSATTAATTGTIFSFIDSITCDTTGHVTQINTRQQTIPQEPYLVYSALLTQTGTNAPVANVLQNTIPGTLTWSRNSVGTYILTSNGTPFTANKVQVFLNGGSGNTASSGGSGLLYANRWESTTTDTIAISTSTTGAAPQDGNLTNASIEIRIYS